MLSTATHLQPHHRLIEQMTQLVSLLQSVEESVEPVKAYQTETRYAAPDDPQLILALTTPQVDREMSTKAMYSPDMPGSVSPTNLQELLSDFDAELAKAGIPCPILPGLLRIFNKGDDLLSDPAFSHIHKMSILQALRNDGLLPHTGESAEDCVSYLLTRRLDGYVIPTSRLFRKLNNRVLEPNTDYLEPNNKHLQVPGFTLKAHIGTGGHAFIYLATCRRTGEDVVIKIGVQEKIPLSGISNEFRFQADLQLRHVAHAHEMGKTRGGFPYLVLKFYKNKHLTTQDFISRFTLEQRVPLIRKIIEALAEAHRAGIIHSDVKMSNIFWDEAWNAFLGDFGIASSENRDTLYRFSFSGTQTFVAPEFLDPFRYTPVHFTKDIYSLGILMIMLLRKDFTAITSHPHAISLIKHSGFNDDIRGFLNKCIATKPEDRFQNAQECLEAFDQVTFGYVE